MTTVTKIIRPHRRTILGLVFFGVMAAGDGIVSPFFLGQITDGLSAHTFARVLQRLIFWGLALLLVNLANLGMSYFSGRFRQQVNLQLRRHLIQRAYAAAATETNSSSLLAAALGDVKQIEQSVVQPLINMLYSTLQGSMTLIFVLHMSGLTGFVFVALGFVPAVIPHFTARWLKAGTRKWQETNECYTSSLSDTLAARPLFKHYQLVTQGIARLDVSLRQNEAAAFVMNFRQQIASGLVGAVYAITTTVALAGGVWAIRQAQLSVGLLLTTYTAADRVVTPLINLTRAYGQLQAGLPLLNHVLRPVNRQHHRLTYVPKVAGLLKLERAVIGVTKPLFQPLNLTVFPGMKVLIQGPSGIGKSTLLQVILHDRMPLSGRMLYAAALSPEPLKQMAVVHQQPFIFADTLSFNLTLGRTISEAEQLALLQKVGLTAYANHEALGTRLGIDGVQLSGGEQKRLELARALVDPRPILLIDEALSGLDQMTAATINRLILAYPGTVIDIEHQLPASATDRYDAIIKLHLVPAFDPD